MISHRIKLLDRSTFVLALPVHASEMASAADTASAPASRPYLCHLISNTWVNFRVPELRAVAGLAGVELAIDPVEEAALLDESVFLQVRVGRA